MRRNCRRISVAPATVPAPGTMPLAEAGWATEEVTPKGAWYKVAFCYTESRSPMLLIPCPGAARATRSSSATAARRISPGPPTRTRSTTRPGPITCICAPTRRECWPNAGCISTAAAAGSTCCATRSRTASCALTALEQDRVRSSDPIRQSCRSVSVGGLDRARAEMPRASCSTSETRTRNARRTPRPESF